MGHVDAPKINYLTMIDEHRIELYWDQVVTHSDITSDYLIKSGDTSLDYWQDTNDSDHNWAKRPIFEPTKKRTTLYLNSAIAKEQLNTLTVQVVGKVTNQYDEAAHTDIVYRVTHWTDYYGYFTQTDTGIVIKSSRDVSLEAHQTAKGILDALLGKIPQVAEELVRQHADFAIYGYGDDAYDVPEHRGGAEILGRPVEGFGGTAGDPTTSISQKNVLRITDGVNQTRYLNECIVVHEFGHAIHLLGINNLADQTLANDYKKVYQHAKDAGLWPNTYLIANYEEYFATLTTIWFNVMAESVSGTWDGVRGPINTREEFKQYDPVGYDFFSRIYEPISLPRPWDKTPVYFPYHPTEN